MRHTLLPYRFITVRVVLLFVLVVFAGVSSLAQAQEVIDVENSIENVSMSQSSSSLQVRPMGVLLPEQALYNTTVTLETAVVVNHPPLGMSSTDSGNVEGFMPDVMEEIQRIAFEQDNVKLSFNITPVPLNFSDNTFEKTLNMVSIDCDRSTLLAPEDCSRYDLLVGSYWPSPGNRSLKTLFSPPLMETGYVTARFLELDDRMTERPIETLEQANVMNATVCLRAGDNSIETNLQKLYPNIRLSRNCGDHEECLEALSKPEPNGGCSLYVGHELVLRYLSRQRGDLAVNLEYALPQQLISWAFNSRLDQRVQFYLSKWMYEAKQNGFIGNLFHQYFDPTFCPLGKAGPNCSEPCHPFYGEADRHGQCICISTKWTGGDCSIEKTENYNLIPSGAKVAAWMFVGTSFFTVVVCAIWLFWKRHTTQIEAAQPLFLGLVLVGCTISTSTIIALAQESTDDAPTDNDVPACMAIPWLYSVGFCITFGALFAKIRRVSLLFSAAEQLQRTRVTTASTLTVLAVILLIDVTILIVWTVVSPQEWQRTVLIQDKYGEPLSSVGRCVSDHWAIFVGVIGAYHFLLLSVACYMCYVARDVPTLFSEGKYITIAVISNLQIFVIAVPVLIVLGGYSEASFFIASTAIWMNDLVVVLLIFGNLIHSVHFSEDGTETRNALIASALRSYQVTRRRNTQRGSASSGSANNACASLQHFADNSGDRRSDSLKDFGALAVSSSKSQTSSRTAELPFSPRPPRGSEEKHPSDP